FLVTDYFNLPYLMPLVELVPGPKTTAEIMDRMENLYIAMGKKPIRCLKEAPGFIANRIQLVIWREAFNIVQKGIASPEDVDKAVKFSFGRRLGVAGPFEIYEHNDGYDLTLQCEKYMLPDMDTSPEHYKLLLDKVASGELGEKTGKGFYQWTPEFTEEFRRKMFRNLVKYSQEDLKE
ncbi:MAG: 3-hydroxyacyl-CoA dehydrogenase family protein, partial [Deltaproteobacteria bacterium]|nr:3-hydroxyacyl-CoA dehydrogenase family protein [Deltaproteobacteria bacterium]